MWPVEGNLEIDLVILLELQMQLLLQVLVPKFVIGACTADGATAGAEGAKCYWTFSF